MLYAHFGERWLGHRGHLVAARRAAAGAAGAAAASRAERKPTRQRLAGAVAAAGAGRLGWAAVLRPRHHQLHGAEVARAGLGREPLLLVRRVQRGIVRGAGGVSISRGADSRRSRPARPVVARLSRLRRAGGRRAGRRLAREPKRKRERERERERERRTRTRTSNVCAGWPARPSPPPYCWRSRSPSPPMSPPFRSCGCCLSASISPLS